MTQAEQLATALVDSPLVLGLAGLMAVAASELFFGFLMRVGQRSADRSIALAVARRCRWPSRFLAPAVACDLAVPFARLTRPPSELVQHVLVLIIIGASAWFIVSLASALEDTASVRYPIDVRDNLRARRLRTRIGVVRRIVVGVVSLLALAAMLTTFEGARALGASLLASAGIVGVVVGVAARPTVSNVVAGLQIFASEPLRVDDVVVIEGEWGRVEEIRLTYVVIRLWDERRLVVPLMYILDHPFQNWTRHTANIMAAVYMSVDYMTRIDDLRRELGRILEGSDLWDRRFWNLQVTDVTPDAVQVRALMTAGDARAAWDLRCDVREKLLSYVQVRMPSALPRRRLGLTDVERQAVLNGRGAGFTVD